MRKSIYLILLPFLAVLDAFLISRPNMLGKLGLWIFKYGLLKNFPNALLTVVSTLAICFILAFIVRKVVAEKMKRNVLLALAGLSLLLFAAMILKFNSGSYAHTGLSFRIGMMLLPLLMSSVFISYLLPTIDRSEESKVISK